MRPENGSPLPVAGDLRGSAQLQILPLVPDIHNAFLLPMRRSLGELDVV